MTPGGIILAVFGIIVSGTFGFLGIRYALKNRNKPILSYIEESFIPLFRSIVKNMEDLEILYEKKPINPSLVMLKGCFINSGNIDIDSPIIYKPVSIKLPEDWKWIKAKIIDKPSDMKADCTINNSSELEFKWDLLKKGEFLRFDSLIEVPLNDKNEPSDSKEKRKKTISFSYRISNLDRIEKFEKRPYEFYFFNRILKIISYASVIFLLLVSCPFIFFPSLNIILHRSDPFADKYFPYFILISAISILCFTMTRSIKSRKLSRLKKIIIESKH